MTKSRRLICPQCNASFAPWRAKRYCSERCRVKARDRRLRKVLRDEAIPLATTSNPEKKAQGSLSVPRTILRYEPLRWIAVNAVTWKALQKGNSEPVAWAIKASAYGWQEAKGWYGRIGKAFAFGPTTESRAKAAVEAALQGKAFKAREGEILRQGTLGRKLRWYTRR